MVCERAGRCGCGSFYALDPTIIPWDLTNPVYKYVGVTLTLTKRILNNSCDWSPTWFRGKGPHV
jgi:hypothetical protein